MDSRDAEAAYGKWYNSFDENKMEVAIALYDEEEELYVKFPVKYEVCGLCNGNGSHVNPSIDAHGISSEEFDEDPGFKEEYLSGTYDVSCYRCGGKRVEPKIDEETVNRSKELKKNMKLLKDKWRDDADYRRECETERRMGC